MILAQYHRLTAVDGALQVLILITTSLVVPPRSIIIILSLAHLLIKAQCIEISRPSPLMNYKLYHLHIFDA